MNKVAGKKLDREGHGRVVVLARNSVSSLGNCLVVPGRSGEPPTSGGDVGGHDQVGTLPGYEDLVVKIDFNSFLTFLNDSLFLGLDGFPSTFANRADLNIEVWQ